MFFFLDTSTSSVQGKKNQSLLGAASQNVKSILFHSKSLRLTTRKIKSVSLVEDDNFEITKSDSLAAMLIGLTSKASMGFTIVGIITLLGAAIGLMNIMLVSVTERTREIGIRKALGATSETIKMQFLIESTVICFIGGVFGILMGIIMANGISLYLSSDFFMPWFWVIFGFVICLIVGL